MSDPKDPTPTELRYFVGVKMPDQPAPSIRPTPETAPRMHAAANESIERMFRCGCDLERQLAEVRAQLAIADEQIRLEKGATAEAQSRCHDLQAWKDSMLKVEASCDMQQVARLLGLPLGADIRPALIPAIERLKSQMDALANALQAYHLPYTDIELEQLAACETGMGEVSPSVAQREINSRAALAAIEGGAR